MATKTQGETAILYAIRDALLATGRVMLWRNNVGALRDRTGRVVRYGLGVGSPDLVGIVRPIDRMLCVEVKVPGEEPDPDQVCWHRAARAAGALVIVAHSVAEALAGLEAA